MITFKEYLNEVNANVQAGTLSKMTRSINTSKNDTAKELTAVAKRNTAGLSALGVNTPEDVVTASNTIKNVANLVTDDNGKLDQNKLTKLQNIVRKEVKAEEKEQKSE